MKPFFCIDIGDKEKKYLLNGAELVTASVPEELTKEYRIASDKKRMLKEKAELPNILKIATVLVGLMAVLSVATIVMSFFDAERAAALEANGYTETIGMAVVGALLCGFLIFYGKKRKEKVLESFEFKNTEDKIKKAVEKMRAELLVPADALETEVLAFPYKVKGETVEFHPSKDGYKRADNCKFMLFKEGESLVFSALDKKFAFPISGLKCLKREKAELVLSYWHKNEKYDSDNLKAYKMDNRNGNVIINEYLSLYIEREIEESTEKEIWTVNFPIYEKDAVESITGLKAE